VWRLPTWFFPEDGRKPLTYHPRIESWGLGEDHTLLQSACRGQEFVLDVDQYPEAVSWACGLISCAGA